MFKSRIAAILGLVLLAAMGLAQVDLAHANSRLPPPTHAMWVYPNPNPATLHHPIATPDGRQALIEQSAASRITILYLSVYSSALNRDYRQMYDETALADLIAKAHSVGVSVIAAYGDADWPTFGCDASGFPLRRLQDVIGYNAAHTGARLDGVMLDIEPPTPTTALLAQYQCFQEQAAANGLSLSVAIRWFWSDFLPFNVATKEAYKHVVDIIANPINVGGKIVNMGYADHAQDGGVIFRNKSILSYAQARNGVRYDLVLAGLETLDGQAASAPETFFQEGQAVLNIVSRVTAKYFGPFTGLGGFAVHNYQNSYLSGNGSAWPLSNPNFPVNWDDDAVEAAVPGPNSTVALGNLGSADISLSFGTSAPTRVYAATIDPTTAGTVPNGYVLSNQLAFELVSTPALNAPALVCFTMHPLLDAPTFATLAILHNAGAGLVDVTAQTPAPDPLTQTICGNVTSFSPFAVASKTDVIPPSINNAGATPAILWPPNKKLVDVTVGYVVTDNFPLPASPASIVAITSNEPIASGDAVIKDAHHVQLRADRAGNGHGRTYTITIVAVDAARNTARRTLTVIVPHDAGP